VSRADNLTTFMCRLSWNLGASAAWNPQGLSRPVMGLLYLTNVCDVPFTSVLRPVVTPISISQIFPAVALREYLTPCLLYSSVLAGVIGLWKWVSYQAVACDWQIRIDLLLQCSDCPNRMDVQGRSGDVTHKTAPQDSCSGSPDVRRPALRFSAVELRHGCLS
jgi:hypothetical protein